MKNLLTISAIAALLLLSTGATGAALLLGGLAFTALMTNSVLGTSSWPAFSQRAPRVVPTGLYRHAPITRSWFTAFTSPYRPSNNTTVHTNRTFYPKTRPSTQSSTVHRGRSFRPALEATPTSKPTHTIFRPRT